MTPERALEHDERCERYYAWQLDGEMICRCAERALVAARRREEEAKGEIARERRQHNVCDADFRHALNVVTQERDALRAENDRLAASESARTLQVRIAELEAGERHCDEYHGELADQVTALRGALSGLMDLIDEGRLVRNTTNDHHMPSYLAESVQLVKALARAKELLPQDRA